MTGKKIILYIIHLMKSTFFLFAVKKTIKIFHYKSQIVKVLAIERNLVQFKDGQEMSRQYFVIFSLRYTHFLLHVFNE